MSQEQEVLLVCSFEEMKVFGEGADEREVENIFCPLLTSKLFFL